MNYKQLLTRTFNNLAFRKKIFIHFFILIVFSLVLFNGVLSYIIDQYNKEIQTTNAQLIDTVIASIESEMTAVEEMTNYIIGDETIQENLIFLLNNPRHQRTALVKNTIYESFYPYSFSNDAIQSISILSGTTDITMGRTLDRKHLNINRIIQEAIDNKGRLSWVTEDISGSSIYCVRALRQRKYLNLKTLGILLVQINIEAIIQNALEKSGYPPTTTDFLLYSGQQRIYPNDSTHSINNLGSLDANDSYYIKTIHDKKTFIISGTMSKVGWSYYYFRDYNTLFNHLIYAKWYSLLAITAFSLVLIVISNLYLKSIFKHWDLLLSKIKNFGNGVHPSHQHHELYNQREDEIGTLHQHFDEMTHRVNVLRDENYEKQIHLKDATIKMLEQQINPHFLYNTLDLINWMAQIHNADEISTVVIALGKLFRASITEEHELIPLSQELNFLNNYLSIQKIRFNERLHFKATIPEEYNELLIPKLSLQPLVENALKHGMESMIGTCYIELTIQEDTKTSNYIITVSNTGSSFEPDLLERIHSNDLKPLGTGVGLTNIDSRLKLLFGDNYGLSFYNKDGKAHVSIHLPWDINSLPL